MFDFDSDNGKGWMKTAIWMLLPATLFGIVWIVLEYIVRGSERIALGRAFGWTGWITFVAALIFFVFGAIMYAVETKKQKKIRKRNKNNKMS